MTTTAATTVVLKSRHHSMDHDDRQILRFPSRATLGDPKVDPDYDGEVFYQQKRAIYLDGIEVAHEVAGREIGSSSNYATRYKIVNPHPEVSLFEYRADYDEDEEIPFITMAEWEVTRQWMDAQNAY